MSASRIQKRRVLGIDLVTIPLPDYLDLLAAKKELAVRSIDHTQFAQPSRSPIERNSEVAVFLVQKFGTMPVKEILRLCRRRFGKSATPSRSAAYAYWKRVRREASAGTEIAAI